MKLQYLAVALLAFAAISQPVLADQKEEAYAAIEHWADAFNSGDVERILGLYTSDALAFGTFSPNLSSSPGDLRADFKKATLTKSKVTLGKHSVLALSNDAVVIVGFCALSAPTENSGPYVVKARFSFVMVKKGDVWQIAHQHLSLLPKRSI